MSTTGDKGKGKLGDHAGAGTLASSSAAKVSYEALSERLKLSDDPDIPMSATLIGLGHELGVLKKAALVRSQHAEKALLILQGKIEVKRSSSLAVQEDCRAVENAEPRKRIRLKKRKAESDHAGPVAVSTRQATAQGPAPTSCFP